MVPTAKSTCRKTGALPSTVARSGDVVGSAYDAIRARSLHEASAGACEMLIASTDWIGVGLSCLHACPVMIVNRPSSAVGVDSVMAGLPSLLPACTGYICTKAP